MPKKSKKIETKIKKTAKTKTAVKKTIKKKSKPADSHVKSFYRPKALRPTMVQTEEMVDTKIDTLILVPVAIVLALTSIGLHLMLAISFSSQR